MFVCSPEGDDGAVSSVVGELDEADAFAVSLSFFPLWVTCFHSDFSGFLLVATVVSSGSRESGGLVFRRQAFARWPICLQCQQFDCLSSTTTIICLSRQKMMSRMVWKPSLLRHIWNM